MCIKQPLPGNSCLSTYGVPPTTTATIAIPAQPPPPPSFPFPLQINSDTTDPAVVFKAPTNFLPRRLPRHPPEHTLCNPPTILLFCALAGHRTFYPTEPPTPEPAFLIGLAPNLNPPSLASTPSSRFARLVGLTVLQSPCPFCFAGSSPPSPLSPSPILLPDVP